MSIAWQGEELLSPSSYGRALASLQSPEEGAELVALVRGEYGDVGVRQLAYALGELGKPEEYERAQRFLGMEHPIIGDLWREITPVEVFELGAAFGAAQMDGLAFDDAAAKAREVVRVLRRVRRAT